MTVTVCLNAIVKNEEKGIMTMLESVKDSIHYYVIVDTGSTDRTKEVIKEYFDSVGIKGEIHDRPWYKDFGRSRTEALQLCYGKSDYVYISDATDRLHGKIELKDPLMDGYKVKLARKGGGIEYWRVQIVKNDPELGWKYVGVLHEYITCPKPGHLITQLKDCHVEYNAAPGDRDTNPNKYKDDAEILEQALEKEPDNDRYQFYLAQSYKDAGMYDKAISAYKKRIEMGKWYEEVYMSYYGIGLCLLYDNAEESKIVEAFIAGYNYCKHRAESLYQLARYFRMKRKYAEAYKYAMIGVDIPYPKNDVLFISKFVYDYGLKDEAAISAYYIGEHKKVVELNGQIYDKVPQRMKKRIRDNAMFSINILKNSYLELLNLATEYNLI